MSLELELQKTQEALATLNSNIVLLNKMLGALPNLTFAIGAEAGAVDTGSTLNPDGSYQQQEEGINAGKGPSKTRARKTAADQAPAADNVASIKPATVEDARKKAMDVSNKFGKGKVKELLKKHGTPNITGLQDFAAFVADCDDVLAA